MLLKKPRNLKCFIYSFIIKNKFKEIINNAYKLKEKGEKNNQYS